MHQNDTSNMTYSAMGTMTWNTMTDTNKFSTALKIA